MKGFVHSIETFGTVDGPGIRYVLFLQGCPMRCRYCHNPDTWKIGAGVEKSASEILNDYESYRPFLRDGGLTVTGGEPLLQTDFLIELFEGAKKRNIHTCIDTSGITFNEENAEALEKLDRLMTVTDLILLDIKHIDPDEHKSLTGYSNIHILEFAMYLMRKNIPVWIRHVVIPELTLKHDYLYRLGLFLSALTNMKALDVLPYHDMGKEKYESMGIVFPLKDVKPVGSEEAVRARNIILDGIRAGIKKRKAENKADPAGVNREQ